MKIIISKILEKDLEVYNILSLGYNDENYYFKK